jgi:NADH dehydrogenase
LPAQKIHFKSPEGMVLQPMPYTHLIIAVGLVPNMGVVPGMAAHGLAMQTVGDAYHLRDHVLGCLEMAANTSDSALRRELLTVVTVGAGFSGVERWNSTGFLPAVSSATTSFTPPRSKNVSVIG